MGPRTARASRNARLAMWLATAGAAGCAHHAGKSAAEGFAASTREAQATTPPEQQITHVASRRVVEGALAALDQPAQRAQLRQLIDDSVAEAVASAMRVALPALDQPAQRARLHQVVDETVAEAVASAMRAALAPRAGAAAASGEAAALGRGPAAILAGQIGRAATEDALGRVASELGGQGALRRNLVATGAVATDAAVGAALGELFPECRGDDDAAAACRRGRVQALTRATAASFSAGVRDSLAWPLLFLAAVIGMTIGVLAHWVITLRRRHPHALHPV